ncbi:MAG: hypothetical protein ACLFS8_03375 [Clostridia bacterium]
MRSSIGVRVTSRDSHCHCGRARAKVTLDIRKAFMIGASLDEMIGVLRMRARYYGAVLLSGMLPELLPKSISTEGSLSRGDPATSKE